MSGIAGMTMAGAEAHAWVEEMLDRLAHRGRAGRAVIEAAGVTLGAVWPKSQRDAIQPFDDGAMVHDSAGSIRLARAKVRGGTLRLARDPLGVAPLYYGRSHDGTLVFASEVKALLAATSDVHALTPGSQYDGRREKPVMPPAPCDPVKDTPENCAREVRSRLASAVEKCLQEANGEEVGCWLSGGLDSSAIAAFARPLQRRLHTFAAGIRGAPDLEYARRVAEVLGTEHQEVVLTFQDIVESLPRIIYHLESFDARLVRSSVGNFFVACRASQYVPVVLSGEGSDELFAGYSYLRAVALADLASELHDLTQRLHNTALQRVDRCAAAHGLLAQVPFLDPNVAGYALSIPAGYKICNGIEKWILRRALDGLLPNAILTRTKAKFWEGAGIGEHVAAYAEQRITDAEFQRERRLPNGWALNSKEELLYYRLFREHFGDAGDLSWMGRTKDVPMTKA